MRMAKERMRGKASARGRTLVQRYVGGTRCKIRGDSSRWVNIKVIKLNIFAYLNKWYFEQQKNKSEKKVAAKNGSSP